MGDLVIRLNVPLVVIMNKWIYAINKSKEYSI